MSRVLQETMFWGGLFSSLAFLLVSLILNTRIMPKRIRVLGDRLGCFAVIYAGVVLLWVSWAMKIWVAAR